MDAFKACVSPWSVGNDSSPVGSLIHSLSSTVKYSRLGIAFISGTSLTKVSVCAFSASFSSPVTPLLQNDSVEFLEV